MISIDLRNLLQCLLVRAPASVGTGRIEKFSRIRRVVLCHLNVIVIHEQLASCKVG